MKTNNDQTAGLTDAELEELTAPAPPHAHDPASLAANTVGNVNAPVPAHHYGAVDFAGTAPEEPPVAEVEAVEVDLDPVKSSPSEDALWAKALQRNPRLKRPSA